MANDVSLSLRAWPSTDASRDSISSLISRINDQRGSFRSITEEILEQEVQAQIAGECNLDEQETGENIGEAQDVNNQGEEAAMARVEILKQVAQAYMESAHALDFISLVLSKHAPVQAQLSMSPFLKQNLPMGSLGVEIMQKPQRSDVETHNDETTSLGWKMQSLGDTADALLRSASRLEEEIGHETKYWEQVLAIKEHGWSLCRLPREKHTLGVRYGFAEAYSDFRDRGLAALRRDGNGNVKLDRGTRSSKDQRLRVRIRQHGKIIASNENETPTHDQDVPVEQLILRARNSIFDEELQHELHREARNLANQDVKCMSDVVVLPYEADKQIEIELVPFHHVDLETRVVDDAVPNSIAICLRILLCHAHRQNLIRRSNFPPPIRGGRPPRPLYAILKPILENLRHRFDLQSIMKFLSRLRETLLSAGLGFAIEDSTTSPNLANLPKKATEAGSSASLDLVGSLTAPLHYSMTLRLPFNLTNIRIHILTNVLPPAFGTIYEATVISSPPNLPLINMPQYMHFTSASSFRDHILHLITLELVANIPMNLSNGGLWTVVSPNDGQLTRRSETSPHNDRFCISVHEEWLRVKWTRSAASSENEKTTKWSWGVDEVDTAKEALIDVIKNHVYRE